MEEQVKQLASTKEASEHVIEELRERLQSEEAKQMMAAREIGNLVRELRQQGHMYEEGQRKAADLQRQELEEVKAEVLKQVATLQEELTEAKREDLKGQLKSAKDQADIALAENAKLRREVQALTEAQTPQGGQPPDSEDSFWSRVMASIACARTPARPGPGRTRSSEALEPVRLAVQ